MRLLGCICLLGLAGSFLAQKPRIDPTPTEVQRPPLSLPAEKILLSAALADISRQSGVATRLASSLKDLPVSPKIANISYWQAVDHLAALSKTKPLVAADGSVSLHPAPANPIPPTSYDGEFYVRIRRLQATKDFESDRDGLLLALEVGWTPNLMPFFVDSHTQNLNLRDASGKALEVQDQGSSLAGVEGRTRFFLDVSLPALPRKDTHLGSLTGHIPALIPSKFLTYRFADLATLDTAVAGGAVRKLVLDGVSCQVERIIMDKDRWTTQLSLEYPPGGRTLETFQASSLVVNNEAVLVHKDGKKLVKATGSVIDVVGFRRAVVSYHFPKQANPADWTLRYRAPARIVEVPIRFRFTSVVLP
jgi:hypothetical protein